MPEWCPKCHAMLSPGQDKCPACGALLPKSTQSNFTNKDILAFSLYFLGIALIPILLIIGIGMTCALLNR
jgi:zinc-ribbon domain